MRKLFFAILLFQTAAVMAQLPEDALRYAYPLSGGTARNQAIGGAGGSLGGDLTSANINPAGIGLYKNKEFVLSPGFSFINNKFNFLDSQLKKSDNAFSYGTSGFVFGHINKYDNTKSSAFSISINQLANYNNHIEYSGFNNGSSWSEQYLEQAKKDLHGTPEEITYGLEHNYIFGTTLAFNTYLIDTVTDADGFKIQSLVPLGDSSGVIQHNIVDTKGGAHEVAFAFANNVKDKLNLGASIAIPFYSFTKDQTYREDDATDNPANSFKYFEYTEHYKTTGVGFNVKFGAIYRPIEKLRLGLAFHTPTFGSFTDKISSEITTHTEGYTPLSQPRIESSDDLKGDNNNAGHYEYSLVTPFRLIASGSWVLSEVSDVKKQKGFITGDIEFVNYGGVRYSAADETNQDDVNYYDELNKTIKSRYKGAVNVRLGGEMKFNTMMGRLGFAYMSSPYKDKQLKGSRILLSGGLGYRNKGFFVDLTYVYAIIKDSQVPYHLTDKANPIADGKNGRSNIVLTFGIKI